MLVENQEKKGTATRWLTLSNGMLIEKVDETNEKAKKRINKKGVEVYEKEWDFIYGEIKSIQVEDNQFGEKEIKVGIHSDTHYVITIKFDSSYGRGFLAQIFNVDLSKVVIFTPWQKKFDDTTRTNLYLSYHPGDLNKVYQPEFIKAYSFKNKVEYKNPEGTPEIEWVTSKSGKSTINTATQIAYLDFMEEKLNQFIKDNNLVYVRTDRPQLVNDMENISKQDKADIEKEIKDLKKQAKKNPRIMDEDEFFNDL